RKSASSRCPSSVLHLIAPKIFFTSSRSRYSGTRAALHLRGTERINSHCAMCRGSVVARGIGKRHGGPPAGCCGWGRRSSARAPVLQKATDSLGGNVLQSKLDNGFSVMFADEREEQFPGIPICKDSVLAQAP